MERSRSYRNWEFTMLEKLAFFYLFSMYFTVLYSHTIPQEILAYLKKT